MCKLRHSRVGFQTLEWGATPSMLVGTVAQRDCAAHELHAACFVPNKESWTRLLYARRPADQALTVPAMTVFAKQTRFLILKRLPALSAMVRASP